METLTLIMCLNTVICYSGILWSTASRIVFLNLKKYINFKYEITIYVADLVPKLWIVFWAIQFGEVYL